MTLFRWGRLASLSESLAIQARSIGSLAHIWAAGVRGASRIDREWQPDVGTAPMGPVEAG
jgi:hypothetical protein